MEVSVLISKSILRKYDEESRRSPHQAWMNLVHTVCELGMRIEIKNDRIHICANHSGRVIASTQFIPDTQPITSCVYQGEGCESKPRHSKTVDQLKLANQIASEVVQHIREGGLE